MAKVTIQKIKNAPDRDRTVYADGERVGTIFWGWRGLGGEQWIFEGSVPTALHDKSVRELERKIRNIYEVV